MTRARRVNFGEARAWPVEWFAALAAVAVYAALMVMHRRFFHDDAFISLRYALNLVQHGELAWNRGEPVEGYTNFLHLILTAGLIRLGLPPIAAVQILNAVSAVALILLLITATRLVAAGAERAGQRALAIFAAGATPAIAVWTLGGLEPVMVAALLTAGVTALLALPPDRIGKGPVLGAAAAFSLAVLTRMDSAVIIAGCGLGLLAAPRPTFRLRLLTAALVVGIPAAVSLLHMAWRYQVYGELLPLTFYAKTGLPVPLRSQQFVTYVRESIAWAPVVLIGTGALVAGIALRIRTAAFRIPGAALAVQIAYVAWSGGDHMTGARVFVVAIVPATLVLLAVIGALRRRTAVAMSALAALASLGAVALQPPLKMDPAAFVGGIVGRYIDRQWPDGSLVALHTAGSTPYYALNLRFIDMLGLNDPVIAHRGDVPMVAQMQTLPGHGKGDGAYVLSRRPDFIIAGVAEGSAPEAGLFLTDVELAARPEFAACYTSHQVEIPYDEAHADLGPDVPRPLIFLYYQRTCD